MGPELIGAMVVLGIAALVAGSLKLQSAAEKRIAKRDYSYLLKESRFIGYNAELISIGKLKSSWLTTVLEVDDPNGESIGKIEYRNHKKINVVVDSEIFCLESRERNFRKAELYNVKAPEQILGKVVSSSLIVGDSEYVFIDSERRVLVRGDLSGMLRSTLKVISESVEVGSLENLEEGVMYAGSVMALRGDFSRLERLSIFALEFRRLRPKA